MNDVGGDQGRVIKIDKHPEITAEERQMMAIESYALMWALTFSSMVDRFGTDEALRLIEPAMRHFGTKGALMNRERFGIDGHDLEGMVECLDFIGNTMQIKAHIQTMDEDSCLWIVDKCPFENTSPEVCMAFDIILDAHVQAHNPEFCSYHTSMVSKGDRFCSFVVERRKETQDEH